MRRVEHLMGTTFSFVVRGAVEPATLDDVVGWLRQVDAVFSPFRSDSQISLIDAGELPLEHADESVRLVLRKMAMMSELTAGYFSARPLGRLDPCGFVKGWAVEEASRQLCATGLADHAINGGGDVRTSGTAGGRPWGIGIADPFQPGHLAGRLNATDLAVATAGTAERGCHVIDPHTGLPATAIASLTVAGPDLATADAFATAGVAMGDHARDWLESVPGHAAMAIMTDGTSWTTRNLPTLTAIAG